MRSKRQAQVGTVQRTGGWGSIQERGAGQRSGASKGAGQRSRASRKLLATGVWGKPPVVGIERRKGSA